MEMLELNVSEIRADINKLTETSDKYAGHQKSLDKRISNIESQIASTKNFKLDPDSIISELNERKKRESEVVILNVPESRKPVGTDRRQDDIEVVTKLIPNDLSDTIPDIKLRRLGKPAQGKNRSVLLYTPSPASARAILKSKPAGDTNIKFKASLTPAQQQHLTKLRSELDELIENGATNKTIKYINGIPMIVDTQTFRAPKGKYKET